jgi:hypothetical protein
MNKYKLFFTCAASLLLMSSCYDLDRYPEDQLSAGTFFQTQEHADQAMMGVYSQMTHNDVFGRQFGFDCLGGVGAGFFCDNIFCIHRSVGIPTFISRVRHNDGSHHTRVTLVVHF